MLRTTLQLAYLKRTIRPLYGWTQATPKAGFLDPAWDRSVNIWPGMALMKTVGNNYSLINGTGAIHGLCGLYIGGDGIDEVLEQGVNAIAVWVMDPDAEFQILAPAFDTAQTWTDPGTGVETFVSASTTGANRGKLVPAGASNAATIPVGRLISVDSLTQITIGGLPGRAS